MSMLRNVLTYMGLGPDEDYDDGYLYESADDEIDLTEDGDNGDASPSPRRSARARSQSERAADLHLGSETGRDSPGGEASTDQARSTGAGRDDPHAQRDRPDWLEPPAPTADDATDHDRGSSGRRRISIDEDDPAAGRPARARSELAGRGPVRPLRAVPPADGQAPADGVTVRSTPSAAPSGRGASGGDDEQVGDHVRTVKPRVLAPQSFGEAKVLADEFKAEVPVIMNLQGIERELARRLIDFASGICYALDGGMEKIASQVFLLTPREVEVSDEDRRRIEQRGYDR